MRTASRLIAAQVMLCGAPGSISEGWGLASLCGYSEALDQLKGSDELHHFAASIWAGKLAEHKLGRHASRLGRRRQLRADEPAARAAQALRAGKRCGRRLRRETVVTGDSGVRLRRETMV